jgi:hypothetical protein
MADRFIPTAGPSCVLRIDELVLHGFERVDRYALAGAIERELGRLLGESGAQQALLAREKSIGDHRLDAGSFAVSADATPRAVGMQVARAVLRSLENTNRARAPGSPASARPTPAPGAGK